MPKGSTHQPGPCIELSRPPCRFACFFAVCLCSATIAYALHIQSASAPSARIWIGSVQQADCIAPMQAWDFKTERRSSFDAQVAANYPFLAFQHFPTFVKHTIGSMAMQKREANFENCDHGLGRWISALLFGRARIEYRLAADAAGGGRGKV